MFPIATFFAIIHAIKEYPTQIIKNKNLLLVKTRSVVKTENRNVLNVHIKNSWTQFAHEK